MPGEHRDLDGVRPKIRYSRGFDRFARRLDAAIAQYETLRAEAASPSLLGFGAWMAWLQTPEGRAKRTALISEDIPHYASCMQAILTRRGLASLMLRRYKTQLAHLSPTRRRAWASRHAAYLLRVAFDPDQIFDELFTTSRKEGAWDVQYLLDRDGHCMRALTRFRRAKPPTLTLRGLGQDTITISMDTPLPDIQRRVKTFVTFQRLIFSIKVRRGRKKGDTGTGINPESAVLLAYLADQHRERKVDLLRLAERDTTAENYRWLERRLIYGRRCLKEQPDTARILDTGSIQDVRETLKSLLLVNPPKANPS